MSDRHERRAPAAGPLVVSDANPRYFTVASGDGGAVYLAGSHIWNNLHDGMGPGAECAEHPEEFDFDAYLDFLESAGTTSSASGAGSSSGPRRRAATSISA